MPGKKIEATFDSDNWVESNVDPIPAPSAADAPAAAKDETAKDQPKPKLSSYDSVLKITRVRTERTFKGGMQGKGIVEYTMVYHRLPSVTSSDTESTPGSMCTYNGIMYFKGTIDSLSNANAGDAKDGELVFTITGTWGKDGVMAAVGEWTAIKGSETGVFKGLDDVKLISGGYNSKTHNDTPCWLVIE
ncbi:hypothetical protein FRC17_007805 [Serendipita sp. 399]|nr:hypothetical protein FRC17_007805 [Serendipita sp. 399]